MNLIKNSLFIFLISFMLYGSLNLITKEKYCIKNKKSRVCTLSSLITRPSVFLLDGIKHTRRLIKNRGTSGHIAKDLINTIDRFNKLDLKNGFTFNFPKGSRKNAGYLLLSLADPNKKGYPLIEIWDINKQTKIHSYKINLRDILGLTNKENVPEIRLKHPFLLDDGSIIVILSGGGYSSIVKLDNCGKFVLKNDEIQAHHSLETDDRGYVYFPIYLSKKHISENPEMHSDNYLFDGFAIVNQNLEILKKYSMMDIYLKNNLEADIYGNQSLMNDPFHLNDVQPFTSAEGGNYVLLSMKGHSRIMALDINNEKILWFIDRATQLQHDVDILKNSNNKLDISIFDNNTRMYGESYEDYKNYGNRVALFNNLPINSDEQTFSISDKGKYQEFNLNYLKFDSLKKEFRPITKNEGLVDTILENNSLMIEETNYSRLIEVELDTKKILWQYYNNSNGSIPFMMNWSRRISDLPENLDINNFNECNI